MQPTSVGTEAEEGEETSPSIAALTAFLRGPRAIPSLSVVGILLLASISFLYFARGFFLPVVLALMLHFLLKPLVRAYFDFYRADFHPWQHNNLQVVLGRRRGVVPLGRS